MTSKDKFINFIKEEVFTEEEFFREKYSADWDAISDYWASLCAKKTGTRVTENGMKILTFMRENQQLYNDIFTAKNIGEGLFISPKSISGSMGKLIKEGFCEKLAGNPVCYKLTEAGKNEEL